MNQVYIRTRQELHKFKGQYITAPGLAELLGCSRSTAYRILQRIPAREKTRVVDLHRNRIYLALPQHSMGRLNLEQYLRPVGNPHFKDAAYQRQIHSIDTRNK